MAIEIRPASADDAAGISRIIACNLRTVGPEDMSADLAKALLGNPTPRAAARRIVAWRGLAAEDDQVLAGTAAFETNRLRMLFVDPDRHGRGAGRALVARIVAMAQAQGLGSLEAQSWLAARGFYRHLGFARIRDLNNRGQPTVLMKLSL